MKVLKPFVENLLFETIIPIMLIQHKDVVLFRDDPIEFIRKQNDITESSHNPKVTVEDLLLHLC